MGINHARPLIKSDTKMWQLVLNKLPQNQEKEVLVETLLQICPLLYLLIGLEYSEITLRSSE